MQGTKGYAVVAVAGPTQNSRVIVVALNVKIIQRNGNWNVNAVVKRTPRMQDESPKCFIIIVFELLSMELSSTLQLLVYRWSLSSQTHSDPLRVNCQDRGET